MSDIAVKVENLSKLYHIGAKQEQYATLRSALASGMKRLITRRSTHEMEENDLWALKDVFFEIKHGEVVGIIGRNGAGKSTLLKVLAHITDPTKGRVLLYGRVGSLLEVGTGFHPELTGRDNIYLNGAILGMKRAEIQRKFDEIVAFAEIEKFLDTPVKRYSSGMYVRLAFAVAAHWEPEILVVDEVLAVGDAEFQKKCLGKMGDVAKEGRTVLFVSHNMASIESLCSQLILLQNGQVLFMGDVQQGIKAYLSNMLPERQLTGGKRGTDTLELSILTEDQGQTDVVRSGERLRFRLEILVEHPVNKAGVGLGIVNMRGERIVTFHSHYELDRTWSIENHCECVIDWPDCFLAAGSYFLVVALYDGGELRAAWENLCGFTVVGSDFFGTGKLPNTSHQGYVLAKSQWNIHK